MSEHATHFIPGSNDAPVFTPESGCVECAERMALDRAAADQAHRDDLARDVARAHRSPATVRALLGDELADALDRLAAAYGAES